ncbi:MAG: alpha/beta hydrolase [Byssovorax sp.]
MPLDPTARVLLDQLAASGVPSLEVLPVAQARAVFEALSRNHGAKLALARVEDRQIPGPAGEIAVRIYTPEAQGPLPVLAYLHGGGWVIGSLETHDALCRELARAVQAIVVAVDYRLAPEHPFPAGLEDGYAALAWIAANADSFGGDPAKLAIGGDSAGGNLSAVIALLARDRGGPKIAHQLLIYPVTDLNADTVSLRENAEGYFLTRAIMAWFSTHYITAEQRTLPHASPRLATDHRNLPPATVITAEFDPLRDDGEAYAVRLREHGIPVESVRYDGMIHGFITMPMFRQAGEAIALAAAGLRRSFDL